MNADLELCHERRATASGPLPSWAWLRLADRLPSSFLYAAAAPQHPPLITTPDSDFGGVLFTVAIYVLVALGLNIVVGYAGLLDLGYVGFYAVGAYTVGRPRLRARPRCRWLALRPDRGGRALVSGVILGAPTLRSAATTWPS